MTAPKKKAHSFVYRISFTRPLTRKEALDAVKDSGQFGRGASDYFGFYRAGPWPQEDESFDGEMKVSSIKRYAVQS